MLGRGGTTALRSLATLSLPLLEAKPRVPFLTWSSSLHPPKKCGGSLHCSLQLARQRHTLTNWPLQLTPKDRPMLTPHAPQKALIPLLLAFYLLHVQHLSPLQISYHYIITIMVLFHLQMRLLRSAALHLKGNSTLHVMVNTVPDC